ncbi:calcitonin peptide-receptor component protein [Anaeramoeba ignava]|uniref:DNA-directed RNA polymerase III subunit RPC9 n=1 Tax=Anaeramoeba ignava TaxID=1746090 RepID=A0A9Q0RH35_ANAIG|nr:calcitonin peptide-receptor component protein [Anaeramoeba ignava]
MTYEGMITNYEMFNIIIANRKLRGIKKGAPLKGISDFQDYEYFWVEEKIYQLLSDEDERGRTKGKINQFLSSIKKFKLTAGEVIQIINLKPTSLLELRLILNPKTFSGLDQSELEELLEESQKTWMKNEK